MNRNYILTHLHSMYSIGDSTTDPQLYIEKAKELGMKAICFTEHGNVFNWIKKKQLCDKAGIKFIMGVEAYLTKTHDEKIRDNYHSILIAKNKDGIEELLNIVSLATTKDHMYYKPRISFEEFCNLSDNIITTSACLGSPLANLDEKDIWYEKLINRYDYLEIQPHRDQRQIEYNRKLLELSLIYNKPLIAGTDTHEINEYKKECREIMIRGIRKSDKEDDDMANFDMVFKTYDELINMFKVQQSIDEDIYRDAIENTNRIADMVESFDLDYTFKYSNLYSNPYEMLIENVYNSYEEKKKIGAIDINREQEYYDRIDEEVGVFGKLGMESFILLFSEESRWERDNGIFTGPGRGSVCGSLVAYLLDITDVDPIKRNTVFSRFCNEDRISLGDIDKDYCPRDRDAVFNHISDRLGDRNTSFIITFQKLKVKSIIDSIGRALDMPIDEVAMIKKGYSDIERKIIFLDRKLEGGDITQDEYDRQIEEPNKEMEEYLKQFDEIFYYYKGLAGVVSSYGYHPSGLIGSPIDLNENLGITTHKDRDIRISQCDMKNVDSVNYVKYDILSLKTQQVLVDTFKNAGVKYPRSWEIDWDDEKVFDDMIKSPIGIFQFESDSSFEYLKNFKPKTVADIALVTAVIRPSCASFREDVFKRIWHKNPSKEIDEVLKDSYGYLVYQEQQIAFLQKACGFTGGQSDTIRRAIGKKDKELLDMWLPKIKEGYIANSKKEKEEAEKEVDKFMQIFIDSASYSFGLNHAIAYSMITYLTAYARYYYPAEFICAYMDNATTEDDISDSIKLAKIKDVKILPAEYGKSKGDDTIYDKTIYKGVKSILNVSKNVGDDLYILSTQKAHMSFTEALNDIMALPSTNKTNISTLIKVNYFKQFGKAKKLLKVFEVFDEYKGKKQISKDKVKPGIKKIIQRRLIDNIDGYSSTAKLYRIDWIDIVKTVELMLGNEDFSIKEKIVYQLSYLHYIQDDELLKYTIVEVKFKSRYGSWLIKTKGGDMWVDNSSGVDIKPGDMLLINNMIEYNDKRGRIKRVLNSIDIIELDRRKQVK